MKQKNLVVAVVHCILLLSILISCKKEISKPGLIATNTSDVKSWYESAFPINSKSIRSTLSINKTPDYSQQVQPDWNKAVQYKRFGQDVTEVPITDDSKFTINLKNATIGQASY